MSEYQMRVLIEELEKMLVEKQIENTCKDIEIKQLKAEVERLEHLLTPKAETKN